MNSDFLRIPEPSGPETELLKSAATLPQLSPQLRQRVLAACNRQLVVGKALRTGQQLAVLASSAAGVAVLIWLLLPGTAPPATRSGPATQTDSLLSSPGIPPGAALSLPSPAPSLGNMAATNAAPAAPPTTAPPDAHSPKTAPLPASPPQQQPARP